jgi:GTP-binding protein Era
MSYKVGYVALIGRPNVGKSTLLNHLLGQKVAIISDKPQTTRISILGIKTSSQGQIIFIDNPGIHKPLHRLNRRMMNFVYSALETADLLCLMVDATEKFGHGDEFVIETLKKVNTPLFLLINKIDKISKEKVLPLIDHYKDLLPFRQIIPVSALRGTNLDLLEELIYQELPSAEKIYSGNEISTQSQRFQLSEIIREKVLNHVEQELPYVTAVIINRMEEREPSPGEEDKNPVRYIRASVIVERESHKKIILGRRGRMIKTIGSEARKEIEEIFDTRIYLDLRVQVKSKWRDAADVLDLIEQQ